MRMRSGVQGICDGHLPHNWMTFEGCTRKIFARSLKEDTAECADDPPPEWFMSNLQKRSVPEIEHP